MSKLMSTLVLLAVVGRSAAFLLPSAPCRNVAGGARAGLSAPRMEMQARTRENSSPNHPCCACLSCTPPPTRARTTVSYLLRLSPWAAERRLPQPSVYHPSRASTPVYRRPDRAAPYSRRPSPSPSLAPALALALAQTLSLTSSPQELEFIIYPDGRVEERVLGVKVRGRGRG